MDAASPTADQQAPKYTNHGPSRRISMLISHRLKQGKRMLAPRPKTTSRRERPGITMGEKVRIAIVDDNSPQRFILSKLLGNDYAVETFENGDAFLASTDAFAVVLLDIGMPGLDGYDTCRALRKRPGGDATTVIFVSAHDTADDRIAAYEAGGDDYILKPVAAHELRHKLHSIAAHRKAINALTRQSSTAQVLVQKAFSRVGDLSTVVDALRKLATLGSHEAIAELFIGILGAWDLNGAVRVISHDGPLDRTTDGP
ncbi:MAG: response regulator transcription factor, partial [Rhodocyclaceae bacterium]